MGLLINRKTYMACDLNFISKGQKLFTGSHVPIHCYKSKISETVLDRYVVTIGHYEEVI